LIFTHVPYLKDPYYRSVAWDGFPDAELSTWKEVATSPKVAGIFAGHFHDPRRFLYATRSDGTGLSVDDTATPGANPPVESGDPIAQKTWLAPPLALKNQESASPTARGFLLVRVQKTAGPGAPAALLSVIPFWYADRAHDSWCFHGCVLIPLFVLIALLALLFFWFYRRREFPPTQTGTARNPAKDFWFAIYPALLTLTLLALMEILIRMVTEFAIDRLGVPPFYSLIPIFGAIGGAVGSVLRGDASGENRIVLSSVDTSSRIRAGIVGDIAIGIGGAVTVVFLFERILPLDSGDKNSNAHALLISISFIAGVFGRNIIEKARRKLDEFDQKYKEKQEEDRRATQEASAIKEEARKAINEQRYEEALKLLDAAMEKNPNYVNNYIEKGRALKRLGRIREALTVLQEALKIEPENPKVLYNMACYKALLMFPVDEVLADLEKAFQGDPSLRERAKTDSDLKDLAANPGFQKLITQPDAHIDTGPGGL
jgi:hypothetical protein